MTDSNPYQILGVSTQATQGQIKQAYRRLVKKFHPDLQTPVGNGDQIIAINAAYEILGDPQLRYRYDQQLIQPTEARCTQAQRDYQRCRNENKTTEARISQWLEQIYYPINRWLSLIVNSLEEQIDYLAADPFDEDLMDDFQRYLSSCRNYLSQAQKRFTSFPNPSKLAGVAANLYYCLDQIADGIEELERFTLNYDEYYLHTGQELFRIARSLQEDAQLAAQNYQTFSRI